MTELYTNHHNAVLTLVSGGREHGKVHKISDTISTNSTGGGGGNMESRVARLEENVTDIKVSVGKIETRLDYIEKNMFTKGMAAAYALVAVIAVFSAGWWIVQQYLSPILHALPK
ncbi:hypothetical protein [Shewanella fodinae]|uniref:hypothetical protein n=1 Tax=Shewanella fodinae TaxID=552357 RepID=UPI00167522EB|nr:hypothetical protein [Shewanella fodinae]MCL2905199.1 hypothetical protein [Shewanella fodinae]GGY87844.1 hypothetical protein GCM10007169_01260 [Shewanella fodinae]